MLLNKKKSILNFQNEKFKSERQFNFLDRYLVKFSLLFVTQKERKKNFDNLFYIS